MVDRPGESFERQLLACAYVPEHIPSLMKGISGAEVHRAGHYAVFVKENWLLFVGYPLFGEFFLLDCQNALEQTRDQFKPENLSFIGPQAPEIWQEYLAGSQSDTYFTLDLENWQPKPDLIRQSRKASKTLNVTTGSEFTRQHQRLVKELIERQPLPPLIAELYQAMPSYLRRSPSATLLEGRDLDDRLNAFYVIERAAENFDIYILGAYSKKHYIAHASDLLFLEMVNLAKQEGKTQLQLGLGVNPGIQKFKQKWGGKPFLPYEMRQYSFRPKSRLDWFNLWLDGKA
jgi:hypothetical protein